jgi:hypothetical protein
VTRIGKGTVGALLGAALLAGCGGGGLSRAGPGDLSHGGVSIFVPDRWYGRILFGDPEGVVAIFQVANFEPPKELPAGQEDPIKAMSGGDVLVGVQAGGRCTSAGSLPVRITARSFVPSNGTVVPVPGGHAVAFESACINDHHLSITVDFAIRPARKNVLRSANAVLATLKVGKANS